MAASITDEPTRIVPEGYMAIPVHDGHESPVSLCVLVCRTSSPVTGALVLLRNTPDTYIYLGCLVDAGGRVREWVEIWVQNLDGLADSFPAFRENVSNHVLDARWKSQATVLQQLDPSGYLHTGWESEHPLPTFLDCSKAVPIHPGPAAAGWELCRDDVALSAVELPPYTTSLFRYLHQTASKDKPRFVPVVAGAPENAATISLGSVLGKNELLPLNPQGGLMLACSFCPLGFEEYVDLLGGKAWGGIEHGKKKLRFGEVYNRLEDWNPAQESAGYFFMAHHGRAGRFLEILHLRLQLLLDAIRSARSVVQQQQLPFLNLSAESFRVRLGPIASNLPFLWTARCVLAKPGQACALPIEKSEFRYFLRGGAASTSIYLPEGLSAPIRGSSSVRIRKLLPPDQEGMLLEGTLVTQERLGVSPHDLIWIQLSLAAGRADLYGHLYSSEGLAYGEARFRTVPQKFPDKVAAALRASEGVAFARTPFEIIPLLSTPCDLYSLGVLAVRALLVDDQITLAIALDEMLSLARQVAVEYDDKTELPRRIQAIFEKEPRYAKTLGPHHLSREVNNPAEASRLVPPDFWFQTLSAIVRLFPATGPDSACRDFGDVSSLAVESVFDKPIEEFEKLLVRSRSLINLDWNLNREIHGVVRSLLERRSEG